MASTHDTTPDRGAPKTAGQAREPDQWAATWRPTLLGVIAGVAINLIQKPPWYAQLGLALVLGLVYWRMDWLRRRAHAPPAGVAEPRHDIESAGSKRSAVLRRGNMLWLLILLALILNLLAVVLAGTAIVTAVGVGAWVLALASAGRLAHSTSPALHTMLTQVAAVSAGAAIVIGAQPVVHRSAPSALDGHWRGTFGDHYFRVDGDTVRIVYNWDDGRMLGTIRGNKIRCWWTEVPSRRPPVDAGIAVFRIVHRGRKLVLEGKWGYGTANPSSYYYLVKIDNQIPSAIERKFDSADGFIRGP